MVLKADNQISNDLYSQWCLKTLETIQQMRNLTGKDILWSEGHYVTSDFSKIII